MKLTSVNDAITALGYVALFENIQRASMAYPPSLCSSVHLRELQRNLCTLKRLSEGMGEISSLRMLRRRILAFMNRTVGVDERKRPFSLLLDYLQQRGLCALPLCVDRVLAHEPSFESVAYDDWNGIYTFACDAERYYMGVYKLLS